RRGGSAPLPVRRPAPGLRARERLGADARTHQEEDDDAGAAGVGAGLRPAQAQRDGLLRPRLPARHARRPARERAAGPAVCPRGHRGGEATLPGPSFSSISMNANSKALALRTSCSTPAGRKYGWPVTSSLTVSPAGPVAANRPVVSGTTT